MNSRDHNLSSVQCPFCKHGFVTASGVSHHLETASCPRAQGLSRSSISEFISKRDKHNTVTTKQLEWGGPTHYEITNSAWNGYAWECYLCHGIFTARRLLDPPVTNGPHRAKIYQCANSR